MTQTETLTATATAAEVAAILANDDAERAHGDEDSLLEQFIRQVAAGAGSARQNRAVAAELVKLLDADRPRWYA